VSTVSATTTQVTVTSTAGTAVTTR
jgi:hypothetical protein